MISVMTYPTDMITGSRAVLGGQDRPFSTYPDSGGDLLLYDRNARPISVMPEEDRSRLYASLEDTESSGYTLVQALVYQPAILELATQLQGGVILALDAEKEIVIYRQGKGPLIMYCVLHQIEDRVQASGFTRDAIEDIRYFLKTCYAGWHHVYHEAVAIASDFIVTPVSDTKLDELVQLIQVPPSFPL